MKARSKTPSSPVSLPIGSRASDIWESMLASPMFILENSQIIRPAGAATQTARSSTNRTFSLILIQIVFMNCGLRYGGISITNELLTPFSTVLLSILDEIIVIASERHKNANNIKAATPLFSLKNILIIAIKRGNTPPTLRQLLRAFR